MITFNIVNRAAKRIAKMYEYHKRKADYYESLAQRYAIKAQQHRTAENAYLSGASAIEFETVNLTVHEIKMNPDDLSKRIEAAQKRNITMNDWKLAC